jgi:hypothetical protein
MAFDPAPPTWIPGWSENGTDITIAALTTAFPEMTAAEADATTGDIRKVLFAICHALHAKWVATATADRPTKMGISSSSSVNENTGEITRRYTFSFTTGVLSQEVVNE